MESGKVKVGPVTAQLRQKLCFLRSAAPWTIQAKLQDPSCYASRIQGLLRHPHTVGPFEGRRGSWNWCSGVFLTDHQGQPGFQVSFTGRRCLPGPPGQGKGAGGVCGRAGKAGDGEGNR